MKSILLQLLALVAAYFATPPNDTKSVADLHRTKAKLIEDNDLTDEEVEHVNAVTRAAEVAHPTEEARVAAADTAKFLKPDSEKAQADLGKQPGQPQSPATSVAAGAETEPQEQEESGEGDK